MVYVLSGAVLFPVLVQGGFYPTSFLTVGGLLAGVCLLRRSSRPVSAEYCLWGLAAVYLGAALFHGCGSRSVAQACLPAICVLFLRAYLSLSARQKEQLLKLVLFGSSGFAVLAIFAYCGWIPLPGAVVSRRLYFPFQYANAAGSWFAATALVIQAHPAERLRRLAPLSIMALCLTGSVGALGLYLVLLAACLWHGDRQDNGAERTAVHLFSFLGAAACFFLDGWAVLPALLAVCLAWTQGNRMYPLISRLQRWLPILWTGAIAVSLLAARVRISSAARTFAERLLQMCDGIRCIAEHPLLGFGADGWARAYPFYQTAQYTSSLVHSSIIQLCVDAGLLAGGLAVAFAACAYRKGKRNPSENAACILLIVHSLFDFTFQFFPLDALLLVLLFTGQEPELSDSVFKKIRVPCCLCALGLCGVLLYGEVQYKQCVYDAQAQHWDAVVSRWESHRKLFGRDALAQDLYIRACYELADYKKVIEVCGCSDFPSLEEATFAAKAWYSLGDHDTACQTLLATLENEPYRVRLYVQTAEYFRQWQAAQEYIDAYNRLALRANENQTILASWMGNQVDIEYIQ